MKPRHLSEAEIALASDGELAVGRVRHLSECLECRRRLEALESGMEAFARERQTGLPDTLEDSSLAELEQRLEALERPQPWLHGWAAVACGALLAAAAVLAWRSSSESSPRASVPDADLTPGAVTATNLEGLCSAGWEETQATVPRPVALRVFRSYGIANPEPGAYELDTLIPVELGGSSAPENLWPQPYDVSPWNAYAKDALEDHLRTLVCDGELALETAQRELARDWTAAYRKYFGTSEPLAVHAAFLKDEPWE